MTLQVSRLLTIRGIQKPYNFLRNLGLSHMVVHRLLSGKAVGIKLHQLEKLCLALHCAPDDLMAWDNGQQSVSQDHPLMQLVKTEDSNLTVEELRKLPLDKLSKIKGMLRTME